MAMDIDMRIPSIPMLTRPGQAIRLFSYMMVTNCKLVSGHLMAWLSAMLIVER